MQRAKKPPKKKQIASSSLEKLAESKMPKWRIADDGAPDSPRTTEADAISPKLSELRGKTASAGSRMVQATYTETAPDSKSKSHPKKKSGLVNMIPESQEDARLGAKTQVFEDDEHTGSQG